MVVHLRDGDGDLVLRVLDDARGEGPPGGVPWGVLAGLQQLVPCTPAVHFRHRDRSGRVLLHQSAGGEGQDAAGTAAAEVEAAEEEAAGEVLVLPLPASLDETRSLHFQRRRGERFSERDCAVLSLLRPHLWELLRGSGRRRGALPALTAREWQVLTLVGAGLSTAQIAEALWLSTGTVRKHAEHIRERLGVHSLTAAAAAALSHAPADLRSAGGVVRRRPGP
jgi:DNA-binding CsgD family transcriptional regulator